MIEIELQLQTKLNLLILDGPNDDQKANLGSETFCFYMFSKLNIA